MKKPTKKERKQSILYKKAFGGNEVKGKWKKSFAVLCAFFTLGAGATFAGCETVASVRGADGKDGKDLTVYDLYTEVYEKGIFTGSYEEYLASLKVQVNAENDTTTIAKNIASTVSIVCGFKKKESALKTKVSASAGAGVIVDLDKENGDAYIVTNYHVVYETSEKTDNANGISSDAYVYLYGARVGFTKGDSNNDGYLDFGAEMTDLYDGIQVTYVGGAMDYDIALLKIENSDYLKNSVAEEATLGNSDVVELGEKVFAVGNPLGEGISVTDGIISKDSETISLKRLDGASGTFNVRVLRTSAAINGGNSGGGLYNAEGELIGIVNAKSVEEDVDNMGYALPISMVKNLLHNIYDCTTSPEIQSKGATVAKLGIITFVTASKADYVEGKLRVIQEITVDSVSSGYAGSGKLQKNDIIKGLALKKDGSSEIGEFFYVWRDFQISDWLLQVRYGDTVVVRVERNGQTKDVEVEYNQASYFTKCA